ncbi:alpha/beta-hydrolase [Amylocystis lapponica]|nr:alpha/beta-hydrolase [Amylocystis lapponica]
MQPHLPADVTSRSLTVNDLDMHILEAGDRSAPLLILLHGFPELALSWRKIILPLAQSGYHVVAPDQRGYGRTVVHTAPTHIIRFEDDLQPFRGLNLVRDIVALVLTLGHRTVAAVVGHDFGSRIAAYCALIRPDLFQSVVLMSTPFPGPPTLPFAVDRAAPAPSAPVGFAPGVDPQLAALDPPRKHYTSYFCTATANADMWHAPQGLRAFLRAYFHAKSADWAGNAPHRLASADAAELAAIPPYYIMPLAETMPQVVQRVAPSSAEVAANAWLDERALALYVAEYAVTGFQGGMNWYRCMKDPRWTHDLGVFAGKTIAVPAMFVSGRKDWGVYQNPGALEKMRLEVCEKMDEEDVVLLEGAGHWVQQEQPEQVVEHLRRFLGKLRGSSSL